MANALQLLEALKEAGEPVPLGRLSQQLGLSKGTVHLLLSTLSEYNFVEPALVHGQYRLGLGAFEVGIAAVDHRGMPPEIAWPMERLASESLEAVSLAVQSGHDALIVRPTLWLGGILWKFGDGWLIDGWGPDGVSARVLDVTRNVVKIQTGYLYHYAFAMLIGVAGLITWFMFGLGGQ